MELATISFGQRFEITPIQLVTAVASIANGGNLVTPRFVTAVIDSETKKRNRASYKDKNYIRRYSK